MDEDDIKGKLDEIKKELSELSLEVCRMESSIGRLWDKHIGLHNFVCSIIFVGILFLLRNPIWAFIKFVFLLILGIWGWANSFK